MLATAVACAPLRYHYKVHIFFLVELKKCMMQMKANYIFQFNPEEEAINTYFKNV